MPLKVSCPSVRELILRLWVDLNDVDFWPKAEDAYHARRTGHSYYTMTSEISLAHFLIKEGGKPYPRPNWSISNRPHRGSMYQTVRTSPSLSLPIHVCQQTCFMSAHGMERITNHSNRHLLRNPQSRRQEFLSHLGCRPARKGSNS